MVFLKRNNIIKRQIAAIYDYLLLLTNKNEFYLTESNTFSSINPVVHFVFEML